MGMTVTKCYWTIFRVCAILPALLATSAATAADDYGVFELIHRSSLSYEETLNAVSTALTASELTVHASHEVRVPDGAQSGHVYVLTSPAYRALAEGESPRTVSAQVLRVAVYTWGDEKKTLINMANPVAHAMLFYANSDNYDRLQDGAKAAAAEIRAAISSVSGESVSIQQSPARSEKHYRKFKGDGPARMMAKFRTFQKSQLLIAESSEDDVASVTSVAEGILGNAKTLDASEPVDWEQLVKIQFADDAVYLGLSNPFLEDKMIRINSRFRSDGKSDTAPYPGVDHVAALPTEVLVISEDGRTKLLHYGQMWRMQLYFWDSGYRAFTANVGTPSAIVSSIDDLLAPGFE